MKNKIKKAVFFAAIFLQLAFLAGGFLIPFSAKADSYGLDTAAGGTGLIQKATPQQITGTVIGSVLSLLGVIFFLLIFYGGIRWMLAQGNEAEVDKAKEILVAAVVGLIIVLSAYAITTFIGNQLTSATNQ